MIRKFDRLFSPATATKIIRQKKFLSSLSHQFKYDNNNNNIDSSISIYPRREQFKKRFTEKALNMMTDHQKNRTNMKNYYKTLGLNEHSTLNDIKRAYYILAKKFHPDRIGRKNSSSIETDKFKEISEAYNVLSDESKRIEYDRHGYIEHKNIEAPRTISSQKFQASDITRKLNNILNDNSPITEGAKTVPALHNLGEVDVTVTFLQSIQGTTKDICLKKLIPCNFCSGRGNQIGVRKLVKLCTTCKGTGVHPVHTKTFKGQGLCEQCNGTRYTSENDCNACQRRGYLINDITVPIKIMPGAKANDVIQITHPDGKQKVNVRLRVINNNQFKRVGNDIYTVKDLSLTEAALGGKFRVRGVYGNVLLNLEPGTDSCSERRLKGQGVKSRSGSTVGDLIVKFIVKMPKTLTCKQRSLLTMLQRIEKSTSGYGNDDAVVE